MSLVYRRLVHCNTDYIKYMHNHGLDVDVIGTGSSAQGCDACRLSEATWLKGGIPILNVISFAAILPFEHVWSDVIGPFEG